MRRKQKIAATELLHSWFYGRTLTISELQCRSGKSPHSSTGPPGGVRAQPTRLDGWQGGRLGATYAAQVTSGRKGGPHTMTARTGRSAAKGDVAHTQPAHRSRTSDRSRT